MCVCLLVCTTKSMLSRDNMQKLVHLFYQMTSRDQSQIFRLGGKHLYSLSYLTAPVCSFFEVSQILEFWTVLPKIIYVVVENVRWKWALFLQMSDYPHLFYDFWITFGNPLLWNLSIIPKVFRLSCFCIIYCTISCYFVLPSFLNVKYTV